MSRRRAFLTFVAVAVVHFIAQGWTWVAHPGNSAPGSNPRWVAYAWDVLSQPAFSLWSIEWDSWFFGFLAANSLIWATILTLTISRFGGRPAEPARD